MVHFTYITKYCTIVGDSPMNTGLNQVSELVYGRDNVISRALLYFPHSEVKKLMEDGIMLDTSKMKHILHITNSGSLDFTRVHGCGWSSINENDKIRAASFDLIFFLIPKAWDRGKGFNYSKTHLDVGYFSPSPIDPDRLRSQDGCNWYQARNGYKWDEEGVYANDTLSLEYDKWACGDESVIIGRQHFDYGDENIELDITDIFNKFLSGELENYGIGIAYSPLLESTETEYENYSAWITDMSDLFFVPYVETRYDDVVSDDRSNFVLGKENKLYLYCTIGDHLDNLDQNPYVTIKDSDDEIIVDNIEAKQHSKGIYYIDLMLMDGVLKPDTMLFDTWSGIYYHGAKLADVELDFTLKATPSYFNIGNSLSATDGTFSPSITGINHKEQIKRGDIRKLIINAKPSYTFNLYQLIDKLDFRLYIKDGTREIDVIEWDKVNKAFSENFYVLDTNMLLPQRYHVDIRIKHGMNVIVHHDILIFDIVDDVKNKYE